MQDKLLIKEQSLFIFRPFLSAGAIAAFSDKSADLGFSAGRNLKENRRKLLRRLDINYHHLVAGQQVHAAKIQWVDLRYKGKGALSRRNWLTGTDGFITDQEKLPLAVFTADCLSIFLLDPRKKAIGLIHAGWRGTQQKIAAKAVMMMQEKLATRPKDLLAGFGPCIRRCCYEVDRGFTQLFNAAVSKNKGRYYLDLIAVNRQQLKDAGVKKEHIFDSEICTACCHEDFFSFRKEGKKAGRMMSVIMLKN